MTDLTTIKVPREVRDRIKAGAGSRGLTAAGLLVELLDRYERDERLAAVARAYLDSSNTGYAEEAAQWDQSLTDGLAE